MKKLILIGIGLAAAAAFIGFDAVSAFVDKTRADVRSKLISPEVELTASISEAHELSERCGESVINGKIALARLDSMIEERGRDLERRSKALEHDRVILERRRKLLTQKRPVYLIGDEEYPARTLNRDAVLRARAFATDTEIFGHLRDTLAELKVQRQHTAMEIEHAIVEQKRLDAEIVALKAELENLKARRAVAQTREEAAYIFDRSAFDNARDKVSEIRAKIAEQNKRLDFYGRRGSSRKGLIPADVERSEEDGLEAIASVLGEDEAQKDEEREPVLVR